MRWVAFLLLAGCAATRPELSKALETKRPEQIQMVRAMNQFALDLYPSAKGKLPNAVFSPASIYWALLLLEPGAKGTTSTQLRTMLHAPFEGAVLHNEASTLVRNLLPDGEGGATLRIANGLFGLTGYPFREPFLATGRERYGAELRSLDFRRDAEGARKEINGWVSKQTNEKIPELLGPGIPSPETAMILVNAVYFLARWGEPFNPQATQPTDFTLLDGSKVKVPMMKQKSEWLYGETGPVRVVELGYERSTIVLDIVLPKKVDGLEAVEEALTLEHLDDWLDHMTKAEVILQLPRFKVRSAIPSLREPLMKLGMTDAFDQLKVDLSDIAGVKGDLVVNDAVHQAMIEVDEKGTEASAATVIDVVLTSLGPELPVVEMAVDHPFLFLLRDITTRQVLFIGRVAKPESPAPIPAPAPAPK